MPRNIIGLICPGVIVVGRKEIAEKHIDAKRVMSHVFLNIVERLSE